MIDVLNSLGLPVVGVAVLAGVLYAASEYYKKYVEKQLEGKGTAANAIEKRRQSVYTKAHDAITEINRQVAHFDHCVRHLRNGDLEYEPDMLDRYKKLRAYVRDNPLVFGEHFRLVIYRLTDSGKMASSNEFDQDKYFRSSNEFNQLQNKVLKAIPGLPYEKMRALEEKSDVDYNNGGANY